MIARRDLLIGGSCLVAAGAAYALRPRRRLDLLGRDKVGQIVPMQLADWTGRDVSDLVAPDTPDSLSARLYGEQVERVYTHTATGAEVMVLLAHGDSQTEQLQLHRPERCYPAFGYAISQDRETDLPIAASVTLPARTLVAQGADRQETIIYWARLGEWLPTSAQQQQLDRVRTAVRGYIADGILARFSSSSASPMAAETQLREFIPQLIKSMPPSKRRVLIGTQRAAELSRLSV